MIKNILVTDLLEKCYTKDVKEQDIIDDEDSEMAPEEDELEEKNKKELKIKESFFGLNY